MEKYWQETNGLWNLSNNNINFGIFKEELRPTSDLNIQVSEAGNPIIYVPTHNILDVYEWFRLFKDSHITGNVPFNTNFDKFGFWIHGYFDLERAEGNQDIQSYFPNLYQVKAATTDTLIITGNIRQSQDYIYLTQLTNDPAQLIPGNYYTITSFVAGDNFTNSGSKDNNNGTQFVYNGTFPTWTNGSSLTANYPILTMDGVNVNDTELVLLKNQSFDTLTMIPVADYNAIFSPTITAGAITAISIDYPGQGYAANTVYRLAITGNGGSGATATATTNSAGIFVSTAITNAGSSYISASVNVFSGGAAPLTQVITVGSLTTSYIYAAYTAGLELTFKVGGSLNIFDSVAGYFTSPITSVQIVTLNSILSPGPLIAGNGYVIQSYTFPDDFTVSGAASNTVGVAFIYNGTPPTWTTSVITQQFLLVEVQTSVNPSTLVSIGDITNGVWTTTDNLFQNGLYTYTAGNLVRLVDMDDQQKTYNQIVYCYQGITQENNEYYLRRIDTVGDPNYSLYPWDTLGEDFIYSLGDAYLVKFEFDYTLDPTNPLHPIGDFNATGNENSYRMLFLDQDVATKIMLKDMHGLGTYSDPQTIVLGPGYAPSLAFSQTYTSPPLSGLVTGTIYTITAYVSGDDFSNAGNGIFGVVNTSGYSFISNGIAPTVWTNGSLVTTGTSQMPNVSFFADATYCQVATTTVLPTQLVGTLNLPIGPAIIDGIMMSSNQGSGAEFSVSTSGFGFSVNAITITNGGEGYLPLTTYALAIYPNHAGSGASVTVSTNSLGQFASYSIINGGFGYSLGAHASLIDSPIPIGSLVLVGNQTAPLTNAPGSLVTGQIYSLSSYSAGDDFSLSGTAVVGVVNTTGYTFIYNGTAPTWANGSILTGSNAENGIYYWNGVGLPMTIDTDMLSTDIYYVSQGTVNGGKSFQPAYIPPAGQNVPDYGLTQIYFNQTFTYTGQTNVIYEWLNNGNWQGYPISGAIVNPYTDANHAIDGTYSEIPTELTSVTFRNISSHSTFNEVINTYTYTNRNNIIFTKSSTICQVATTALIDTASGPAFIDGVQMSPIYTVGPLLLDSYYTIETFMTGDDFTNVGAIAVALGALHIGINYVIQSFGAGDDFTSSGASSNAVGTIFTYNGTAPIWTNGSIVLFQTFLAIGTTPTNWSNGSSLELINYNGQVGPGLVAVGSYVLVKDHIDGSAYRGVYIWNGVGAPMTYYPSISYSDSFYIEQGTVNAGLTFSTSYTTPTSQYSPILGTTAVTFASIPARVNTTNLSATYPLFTTNFLTVYALIPGDLVKMQIQFNNNNTGFFTSLDYTFMVTKVLLTSGVVDLELYPRLDDQFINQFLGYTIAPDSYSVTLTSVFSYGNKITDYQANPLLELQDMMGALEASDLALMYDFESSSTINNYCFVATTSSDTLTTLPDASLLVTGTAYIIQFVDPLDDFTMSGALSNAPGTVFIYNGIAPTWNQLDTVILINMGIATVSVDNLDVPIGPAFIDSVNMNTCPIGSLILVNDQPNQAQNGIYTWNGVGAPMVRNNKLNATNAYYIQNGATPLLSNQYKVFEAVYTPPPGQTLPIYGITQISFTEASNSNILYINQIRQDYFKKWYYYGFRYSTLDTVSFNTVVGEFDSYWDLPTNTNGTIPLWSVYGQHYTATNYLENYLGFASPLPSITQLQSQTAPYFDTVGVANRIGFEHTSIYFGENYKDLFLNNLKKNIYINIIPALHTPYNNVLILSIDWDYTLNMGTIVTNYEFITVPATSESINFEVITDFAYIQTNVLNATQNRFGLRPDTASYAYAYMNPSAQGTGAAFTLGNGVTHHITSVTISNAGANYLPLTTYTLIIHPYHFGGGAIVTANTNAIGEFVSTLIVNAGAGYDLGATGTVSNASSELLADLTGIMYKENSQNRVSFRKRDKTFRFPNSYDITYATNPSTDSNISISSAPVSIDGYDPLIGETILVKDQTLTAENGIYYYNGPGVAMTRYDGLFPDAYYYITGNPETEISPNINAQTIWKALFSAPVNYGTTLITFMNQPYKTMLDPRLTMKPVQIAKLGVNNLIQPWQNISYKYDVLESEPNLVTIEIGINDKRRIRFIDGLTELDILNNVNGQGQYAWILADDVIVDYAVVGCTQDTGPGTGTLIWYEGVWEAGDWMGGIWISGTWMDGTWHGGTWNSQNIHDYYYTVTFDAGQNNTSSIWQDGDWLMGTWNGGTWEAGAWQTGTWNGGVWESGTWFNGTWNAGTWESGLWTNGSWFGGDFQTGTWINGTFDNTDATIPSRFGTMAKYVFDNPVLRAIWVNGTFNNGEVWSGSTVVSGILTPKSTDQRATVWWAGTFNNGTWRAGTFVMGAWTNGFWQNGVWIGGYRATFTADQAGFTKQLTINMDQYYPILLLQNPYNNLYNYGQTDFYILGNLTTANISAQGGNITFWEDALFNLHEDYLTTPYQAKNIDFNYPATVSFETVIPAAIDLVTGNTYVIQSIGAFDDFTLSGALTNMPGTVFVYNGVLPTWTSPQTAVFAANLSTINLQFGVAGSCTTPAPAYYADNTSTGTINSQPFVCALWENGTWEAGVWLNGWWTDGIFQTGVFANGVMEACSGGLGVNYGN